MIKIYTGTMASGKSSRLIADIKLARRCKLPILVLSSSAGFREDRAISSRDGGKTNAIGIDTFKDIITLLELEEYKSAKHVFIDEAQFLPNVLDDIIEMVNYSILNNVRITISGLELNCFGKPFEVMGTLFCYADEIVKFKGYCDCCMEDSSRVIRYSGDRVDKDETNVVVVDSKTSTLKYKSLCPSCFINKFK